MTLSSTHLADLKKSGLSGETIEQSGIESIRPCDINRETAHNIDAGSAYAIPYPDTDFCRYRIFYPEDKTGPKYLQKKGTGNRRYIPHSVKSVLHDASIPLYITEGEKKALKAAQEGVHCIGLSGLWNWKNKGEDKLIADFDRITLEGRTVFIVPDSDWLEPNRHGYEKNLKDAVYQLGEKLKERGAKVFIVHLPDEGGNSNEE